MHRPAAWQAQVLIEGSAQGTCLRLDAPISFWGGVDPASARVTLAGHPQLGHSLSGKIVVIPKLIGSSSSSAVMLELIHAGKAPAALILGQRDAILPMGVVVAAQMGWSTLPVFLLPAPPFHSGDMLELMQGGAIARSDVLGT